MQKLTFRNQILIGFTLFSMFFGAGNLIFPPFLGAQAGTAALAAFAGLTVSAVGLPVLGVMAVARAGGLRPLSDRVCGGFGAVFTLLAYLSIGPCLAIPRTASTSFAMAVTPFLPTAAPAALFQLGYSAVFFAVALFLALHPEKLSDRLGRVMCPALLALILLLFAGCVAKGLHAVSIPAAGYETSPLAQGFLDGYQTMDAIAALNFGIVIAINIRQKGVTDEKAVMLATMRAGGVAAVLFVAVYGMLTRAGALSAGAYGLEGNGAATLTLLAKGLFGLGGQVLLAALFVIACLNTCVGLLCCCGEYFHGLLPRWSYRAWAGFFALTSAVISNAGLDAILKFSVPVLECIYPVAIILILLAFLPKSTLKKRLVYPLAVGLGGVFGALYALGKLGIALPGLSALAAALPLYEYGLGWLLPALLGAAAGMLLPCFTADTSA